MAIYKNEIKTTDGRQWYFMARKKELGKSTLYKSKKYLTKQEAKEAEVLFLMKRDNSVHKKFKFVAEEFIEHIYTIRKESSVQSYKEVLYRHIMPYFGDLYINDINIPFLKEYREMMFKMNFKVAYLNRINNVLNLILDYAVVNFGLNSNYNKLLGSYQKKKDEIIPDDKKLRYITYDEFNKFISVIDDKMWYTFFNFLYYTGMRKGEVLALKWSDIKDDTIIINKTLYTKVKGKIVITSTKNNLNRIVKMNKSLYDAVYDYKKSKMQYSNFSEEWYVFGDFKNLSPTSIDRYKHQYFELAGVHEITIHEFRHSAVTLLANEIIKRNNGNVDTTQFFLQMSKRFGHSPEVMQRTYMHLFHDSQDDIVNLLNSL